MKNHNLIDFIITKDSFIIQHNVQDCNSEEQLLVNLFLNDKYKALYDLSWSNYTLKNCQSLNFLKSLSTMFHDTIANTYDIEFLRDRVSIDLTPEDLNNFFAKIPFIHGHEHINELWIKKTFYKLLEIFTFEIKDFKGSVEHYYEGKLQNLNIPERIFFHLVESKYEDYPFAFMATYSEMQGDEIIHKPLKHALTYYENDEKNYWN